VSTTNATMVLTTNTTAMMIATLRNVRRLTSLLQTIRLTWQGDGRRRESLVRQSVPPCDTQVAMNPRLGALRLLRSSTRSGRSTRWPTPSNPRPLPASP
jgi:hypothetical protein